MKIGLISGHKIPGLIKTKETINVETIYGDVAVEISSIGKHDIFFINRHGVKSNLPPQKINYLANIEALALSHVDCILTIGTVGSMKKNIKPYVFNKFCFNRKSIYLILSRAGFQNIRITNSPLTDGDPYQHIKNHTIIKIAKTLCKIASDMIYWSSFRKLIIGPSLLIWAEKTSK